MIFILCPRTVKNGLYNVISIDQTKPRDTEERGQWGRVGNFIRERKGATLENEQKLVGPNFTKENPFIWTEGCCLN